MRILKVLLVVALVCDLSFHFGVQGLSYYNVKPNSTVDVIQGVFNQAVSGDSVAFQGIQYIDKTLYITKSITLQQPSFSFSCTNDAFIVLTIEGNGLNVKMDGMPNFSGPKASCGIGINIINSSLTISGGTFTRMANFIVAKNSTVQLSGATTAYSSYTASLDNSTFSTASFTRIQDYYGITASNSNVNLLDATFDTPFERILQATGGNVQINNVNFSYSSTSPPSSPSPSISLSNGLGNITNTYFFGGNLLYGLSFSGSQISMNNADLSGFRAANNKGGALFIQNSTVAMEGSTFTNSRAGYGGGIYAESSTLSLINCYFSNNAGTSSGGGFYFNQSVVNITSSYISLNTATTGGGIFFDGGSGDVCQLYISNTAVSTNSATNGGGIVVANNSFAFVTGNTTIQSNKVNETGGAVLILGGKSEFAFVSISQNSALNGGAFYISNASTTLIANSSIVNNTGNQTIFLHSFIETTLIIQDSQVQESSPSLGADFCCDSVRVPTPSGANCNFPACNETICKEATGCNCPFVTSPLNPNNPVLQTANYTCNSCHPKYADPFCFVENPCLPEQPNSCTPNQTCTSTYPGYYNCTCKSGFSGPLCEEINECLTNNGGCDKRVVCTSTFGNITCGPCPVGYIGSGYSVCEAAPVVCGDGKCNASIGEDCVSCPLDCRTETCGKCGDGQCDSPGETCANCFEDCHSTCSSPCGVCSEHGTCMSGSCVCSAPWTGPSCNDQPEPIIVIPNPTLPNVTIQPNLPSENLANISFSVFLRSFREIDQNGALVHEINVANFSLTNSTSNAGYLIYEFSAILSNEASVNITFIQFTSTSTYYFYGNAQTYPANTVKMNARIANWPFLSLVNMLEVLIDITVGENTVNACYNSHSQGPWLQWTTLSFGGISIYTQFFPNTYVDGRERSVTFASMDQNTVTAQIPHFWTYAEMDPNFSLLLDPTSRDGCGRLRTGTKKGKIIGIAVAVPIVGIALIVVVAYLIYRHKRMKNTRKNLRKASELAQKGL